MANRVNSKNPYHPDIAIFLIIIPLISAFNYYLTYTNISLNWFLVLTYTIDTVQGYMAWWAVRYFILYLDRKLPYERGTGRRIIIQIISTTILGLFIISLLTELVSLIARGKTAPIIFYTVDLFIIGIWFFVVNGIYIVLHYYHEWNGLKTKRETELADKAGGIRVKHGKQEIFLKFDELWAFFVEGEYTAVCHNTGKKYFMDESLDKIEKKLPQTIFFRLNRQFILHRQLITGFKRLENGKISVFTQVNEIIPTEVQVSRIKAPAFKSWFRAE